MLCVQIGYLDEYGNGTQQYGNDYERAWNAFVTEIYRPYEENRTASEKSFQEAEKFSKKGLDYLLVTVILALTTMLWTIGLSVENKMFRLSFLIIVTLLMCSTGIFLGVMTIT
ncbi:MAG: hypothetical protein QXE27_07740 [Thermoplasmata archaeon]